MSLIKNKSDFFKSVLVLTSGTFIAQLIGYILAPIFTRLYTPEEFGEFGFFFRVVILVSTIATARFEIALPIIKREDHAFQIFRFAIRTTLISMLLCLICSIIYLLFTKLTTELIVGIIGLLFGIFLLSFNNLGTNWAIRTKDFKYISYSKMSNAIIVSLTRIGFGFLHLGYIGLVISFILSYLFSMNFFIRKFIANIKKSKYKKSKNKTYVLIKQYKEFPLVNLPHALLDAGREILIAFLIIQLFDKEIFGSFDHSVRMLKLTTVLIGSAIAQVFVQRASELINEKQLILPLVKKIFIYIFLISIIPFSIVFFFGEGLFAFVFGNQWQQSGYLSELLTFWFMANFLTTPLSSLPVILNKQKRNFKIALINTVFQIGGLIGFYYICSYYQIDKLYTFLFLSILLFIHFFYILYFYFRIAKEYDKGLKLV